MSTRISLPYGTDHVQVDIPKKNLIAVAETKDLPSLPKPDDSIRDALENPLKRNRLSDLARKGSKVVIATSDIMRPGNYRRLILPHVLEILKKAGVDDSDITIIDAVGSHQMNSPTHWSDLYGDNIVNNYKVVNHDCRNNDSLINLGKSDLGDSVIVNKALVESDVCVGVGAVMPACPTCGYDGGVKIFAIGTSGIQTMFETHRAKTYWHPTARSGVVEGNHFRQHIESVGKKIMETSKACFFTIDAVTNRNNEMIGVYAGDATEVFRNACSLADKQWKVAVPRQADILLASVGHPQASNPYEMNISMAMPIRYPNDILKPGGVFIFVAPCDSPPVEGTASHEFLRMMRTFDEPEDIINEVKKHQEHEETEEPTLSNFLLQTRLYGTAITVQNYDEVLVAGPKMPGLVRDMYFTPVRNVERALEIARNAVGHDAEILVVPGTRSSVVYVK